MTDDDGDMGNLMQLLCCCYVKFKAAVMLSYWKFERVLMRMCGKLEAILMVFSKHDRGIESIRSGDGYGVWCVC